MTERCWKCTFTFILGNFHKFCLDVYIHKYVQLYIEQDLNKNIISHPCLSKKALQAYNSNQKMLQRFRIDKAYETLQPEFKRKSILNLLTRKEREQNLCGT